MNSTLADALWKRRFEESERERRVAQLHVRLLQFCMRIRPVDSTSDVTGIVDAFYETSRQFFESMRGRTFGAGQSLLHNMLQDARPIAERDFTHVSSQPRQTTLSDLVASLRAVGVSVVRSGPDEGPVILDVELLSKALLVATKCQEMSGVAQKVQIELARFEGTTAVVARIQMNTKELDPRALGDSSADFRVEAGNYNEISVGLYLFKAYVDMFGGTVLLAENGLDLVIPSASGRNSAPPPRWEPHAERQQVAVATEVPQVQRSAATPAASDFVPRQGSPRPASIQGETAARNVKTLEGKVLNILLVDDNPINLRILTKYLDGHNVSTATNGPDAVELFRKQYYSIVFLDIVLPNDVSGVDVANRMNEVQTERKRAPVPIVAVTGHKVEDYAATAYKAGIKEFLTKPVSKNALLALLVKYCA